MKYILLLSMLWICGCQSVNKNYKLILDYDNTHRYYATQFQEAVYKSTGFAFTNIDSARYYLGKAQAFHEACVYITEKTKKLIKEGK